MGGLWGGVLSMVYRARAGQSESSAAKAALDAHSRIAVSNRRARLGERVTGSTAAFEGEELHRGSAARDDELPALPALEFGLANPAELRMVTDHDDLLVRIRHRNNGEFFSHSTPSFGAGV